MARPREFDVDQVLDRAVTVFWQRGFEGASLPDLLEAMGITRGSLYKAFGSKQQLYLAALKRYDQTVLEGAVRFLGDRSQGRGRERILALFEAVVDRHRGRGCFLCNAATDGAPDAAAGDPAVAAMKARFTSALEAALRDDGEAPPDRAAERAAVLATLYFGVMVRLRTGEGREGLRPVLDAVAALAVA